jgi:hypothetical protein
VLTKFKVVVVDGQIVNKDALIVLDDGAPKQTTAGEIFTT